MVKKLQKSEDARKEETQETNKGAAPHLSGTVKESAQQIWLAGLGAFAKAQEEGGKVFEALVKEGMSLQRKTQVAAEEKISEATSRMASMASDIGSRAAGRWDKLENIFEDRVSKALGKLGVPSAKDLQALQARIDKLEKAAAAKPAAKKAAAPAPAAAKPAAKAAAKRAPARKKPAA